jgi:hypothetical protein
MNGDSGDCKWQEGVFSGERVSNFLLRGEGGGFSGEGFSVWECIEVRYVLFSGFGSSDFGCSDLVISLIRSVSC